MRDVPRISEAEWRVMKVLWERSPATAAEVINALTDVSDWKSKTVKTLLNRLVSKKAIGYSRAGRAYQYHPLVSEAECVRAESYSFLQRVHDGALMPMLASFIEDRELTASEIADLRKLLDKKEEA